MDNVWIVIYKYKQISLTDENTVNEQPPESVVNIQFYLRIIQNFPTDTP